MEYGMRENLFASDSRHFEKCPHKEQVYAVYDGHIKLTSKLERHFSVCPACQTALRALLTPPPGTESERQEFREWVEWVLAELDYLDAEEDRQVN